MNIRDRLMSRASVAVMAAFAPVDKVGQPENVDDTVGAGGGSDMDLLDGLSPEEQAQVDAMKGGADAGDQGNVDPSGDGEGDGEADGDGDADDLSDGDPAPGDGAGDGAGDRQEPPAADLDKRKPPKTINYGRHQKELAKAEKDRADLQARLDAAEAATKKEREERTRLDERAKLLLEAINTRPAPAAPATPAQEQDPEPDKDADPIAHLEWRNRKLEARLEEMSTGQKKQQDETAAEREEREVYGTFSASLEHAARSDETFADAFVHLRETRYRELGFIYANIDINDPAQCQTLTPQQQAALSDGIQRSFYNEQIMTAREARKAGRNPADVVKNLAIARGFVPKAKAPAGDPPPGDAPPARRTNGNGAPPPAARPAPSVTEQIEQIRANQRDAKSLSDAGGAPGGEMTLERLVDMAPEEFEEFLAANKGKVDKMLGKTPM